VTRRSAPMGTGDVLAWLRKKGSRRNVAGMARYGISATHVFGVSMATMEPLAKRLGRNHALAQALWKSGWFEARVLATMVDDPALVTRRQMNSWANDFENWADCDAACFKLFVRTPHAWTKVREWSASPKEFVKRAGFALLASLAHHDKAAPDRQFIPFLKIVASGARDDRNFVKKGVSWALRCIGKRSTPLHARAMALAGRLAASNVQPPRWVGRDVLRDLMRPQVRAAVERRALAGLRRQASAHARRGPHPT